MHSTIARTYSTVWHAKKPAFGLNQFFPHDYVAVAHVETDKPDACFDLTNHIDCSWLENTPIVRALVTHARSTMPGDIMELPDGSLIRFNDFGWSPIVPSTA